MDLLSNLTLTKQQELLDTGNALISVPLKETVVLSISKGKLLVPPLGKLQEDGLCVQVTFQS